MFLELSSQDKMAGPTALNYKKVFEQLEYPTASKTQGDEGKTLVHLWISHEGELYQYHIENSPSEDLTELIKGALKDLKFSPAMNEEGENVAGKLIIPLTFRLTI